MVYDNKLWSQNYFVEQDAGFAAWDKEGFEMPRSRNFFALDAFKRAQYAVPNISSITSWLKKHEPLQENKMVQTRRGLSPKPEGPLRLGSKY